MRPKLAELAKGVAKGALQGNRGAIMRTSFRQNNANYHASRQQREEQGDTDR